MLTPDQLRAELDRIGYPQTYEVTPATYEAVEKAILEWIEEDPDNRTLSVGPNGGLMFKNVELIMVRP